MFCVAPRANSMTRFAGLVFGVVGDIILVFARRWRPALSLGGIAFLIGHTAYVLAFVRFPLSAGTHSSHSQAFFVSSLIRGLFFCRARSVGRMAGAVPHLHARILLFCKPAVWCIALLCFGFL